ncbi:unnamed protein product [Eretmochelys imbricata]
MGGFKPPVCLLGFSGENLYQILSGTALSSGMGLTSHVHLQALNGLPPPLDGVRPHIQSELILGVNACLRCLDLERVPGVSLSQLLIQLPRLKMQEWMVLLH